MRAKEIIEWAVRERVDFAYVGLVDVPNESEQTEQWWYNRFGMTPPTPIVSGSYLFFYASHAECSWDMDFAPDAQIELCNEDNMYGYDYINFYKIDV